jgi:hypothetical protein
MTAHVCAGCLGRVLKRQPVTGPAIYRCSNCGSEARGRQGLKHPAICACGMKVGNRDAGIRCVVNPKPSPECPSEVVAKEC